jgi:thiaminase
MSMHIMAMGQDAYWLAAVHNATKDWSNNPRTYKCSGDLEKHIADLPKPDDNTVLLLDTAGQGDMEIVIVSLRSRGWKYVIVVTADPSAKEAPSILRRNLGYDYWAKTYDEADIREQVQSCFEEIIMEEQMKILKQDKSKE